MDALQEGLAAVKAGQRDRARALLTSYVEQYPDNETGWLWLAVVVDAQEAVTCLERALAINPHSQRAQAGLEWARSLAQTAAPAPPQPVVDARPRPQPDPVEAPAPTGSSGLLKHLGSSTPGRPTSPYAPTRLFTEDDLVTLSNLPPEPDEPLQVGPAATDPATWERAEPVASVPEVIPDTPVADQWDLDLDLTEPDDHEPLGPAPSLAERLGAWNLSSPEAAEPSPSEGLLSWSPPTFSEPESDLGPAPSLAERLGGWGAPSPEPMAPPEAELLDDWEAPPSLAERLSGFGGTRSAPAPAEPSMPDRLSQLRGEMPATPGPPAGPTPNIDELVAQGAAALEAGQPDEAERLFRQALRLDSNHPEAHANLAMVHYVHDRRSEAISELKIAIQHQPDYEDALDTLATLLGEAGRPDEARDAWRQLLRVNPNHAQAQQELARLSQSSDTTRPADGEAIRCPNCNGSIHTAVSTCPHCDYELFVVCPRCKEYAPVDSPNCPGCGFALRETGAGLGSDSQTRRQTADVHTRLGLAHLEDGHGQDALREWQEAMTADPTYAAPHFYTGLLFVEQRQLARAAESFLEAIRRDADYAEAYLELGVIYLAQNKRSMAQRAFEECLKHRPNSEVRSEAEAHLQGLR